MTDKEKFRKEVEKLKSNLIYGACSSQIAMETRCKEEAYSEVLAIIDSKQEESVSIWHDASEKPERDNLLIETNDGRIIHRQAINNYGMVKRWAYTSDLLNLDNSCNLGNNSQEEHVSGLDNGDMPVERWKQAVKAASNQRNYRSSKGLTETRDDYFVDGVQWADENPKEEPVSEDLGYYINELSKQFQEVSFAKLSRIAVRVAKWQKEKDFQYIKKECERTTSCCDDNIAIEAQRRHPYYYTSDIEAYANIGFKEGAMWQKEQDKSTIELAEDHAMLAGMEKMKEEMMKSAVTGQIENGDDFLRIKCLSSGCDAKDEGKLVKLIIIKEG